MKAQAVAPSGGKRKTSQPEPAKHKEEEEVEEAEQQYSISANASGYPEGEEDLLDNEEGFTDWHKELIYTQRWQDGVTSGYVEGGASEEDNCTEWNVTLKVTKGLNNVFEDIDADPSPHSNSESGSESKKMFANCDIVFIFSILFNFI